MRGIKKYNIRHPNLKFRNNDRSVSLWAWQQANAIGKAGYFIDCNYRPTRLSAIIMEGYNDFSVDSNGGGLFTPYSCSLRHCNPEPINKVNAHRRIMYFRKYGSMSHGAKYVWGRRNRMNARAMVKFYKSWNNFGDSK